MKIELWHARGLRIAIDGVFPSHPNWSFNHDESRIDVDDEGKPLAFHGPDNRVKLLTQIDLGTEIDGLSIGDTTGAEFSFINPESGVEMQVVAGIVNEACGGNITTVAGEEEWVDEITLYQLFDTEVKREEVPAEVEGDDSDD